MSERSALQNSQKHSVSERPYDLSAKQNRMIGVTGDLKSGFVAGYKQKTSVSLKNSTDRGALYAVLEKTLK